MLDKKISNEKILSVRMYGEHIGLLEQTATGKMQFTYDTKAPYELSIGMEMRKEPYDEIKTEAYFGGLLPESEMARKKLGNVIELITIIASLCLKLLVMTVPEQFLCIPWKSLIRAKQLISFS